MPLHTGLWLEMEGWGCCYQFCQQKGVVLGVAFTFFFEEKRDLTH